jgi:hypothetical protein
LRANRNAEKCYLYLSKYGTFGAHGFLTNLYIMDYSACKTVFKTTFFALIAVAPNRKL